MKLVRASVSDCDILWEMQIEAFRDLLEKYQDYETSPASEPKEKVEARHTISDYADMAIKTANKRAYLRGEGVKRNEWG